MAVTISRDACSTSFLDEDTVTEVQIQHPRAIIATQVCGEVRDGIVDFAHASS